MTCGHLEMAGANVQRFRGGLVLRLIDFVYHSTLDLRVMKKKKRHRNGFLATAV